MARGNGMQANAGTLLFGARSPEKQTYSVEEIKSLLEYAKPRPKYFKDIYAYAESRDKYITANGKIRKSTASLSKLKIISEWKFNGGYADGYVGLATAPEGFKRLDIIEGQFVVFLSGNRRPTDLECFDDFEESVLQMRRYMFGFAQGAHVEAFNPKFFESPQLVLDAIGQQLALAKKLS